MSSTVIGHPFIAPSHKAPRTPHHVATTTDRKFTIFIVDDDPGVLKSLARLVRTAGYAVRTFSSAIEYLKNQEPEIPGCLVVDFLMPRLDGHQLQAALLRKSDTRQIVFISGTSDVPAAVDAIKAGAVDFLIKPITSQALLKAITAAVAQEAKSAQRQAQLAEINIKLARLTQREAEVVSHVIAGRRNKRIAWDLGTVEKTIKVHRGRAMKKLGVHTVVDLVRLTENAGLKPYAEKNNKKGQKSLRNTVPQCDLTERLQLANDGQISYANQIRLRAQNRHGIRVI